MLSRTRLSCRWLFLTRYVARTLHVVGPGQVLAMLVEEEFRLTRDLHLQSIYTSQDVYVSAKP
jgi:hypothetical protein